MKIEAKILKPKRWNDNFLVSALVKEGVPKGCFVDNINEDVEILVSNSLSLEELKKLKKLSHLIIPTGGAEAICLEDALQKGIRIYHNPSIVSKGVADYVAYNLDEILGSEMNKFMSKSTVGLLGFGNVGKEIYKSLIRYGCHFEAFTKRTIPYSGIDARKGISGLLNLLSNSDIIVNTLPLNEETRELLYNKNSQIKRDALVLSVSRAGIIDDNSILEDTIRGYLRGAILDVYEEDINPDDYKDRNIVLTPHIAGIYGEALNNLVQFIKRSINTASRRKKFI